MRERQGQSRTGDPRRRPAPRLRPSREDEGRVRRPPRRRPTRTEPRRATATRPAIPSPPTVSPPGRRWGRASLWLRRHALSLPLVAGLLLCVGLVLGTGIQRYPGLSDDEGTYVAQAWALLTDGSLAHYTYWYDHPPLGWLQLAVAGWLLSPFTDGAAAVQEARSLMLIPALVSAALVYVLARRLGLRRVFAAVAVLLFALSPLSVSFLRMVFLDNLATPWILGAFVLAASPRRGLWAYAAGGACFGVAVLTKETSLLLLPALGLQVWQGLDQRTRSFCLTAFTCVLALVGLGYPLYAMLKGELLPGPGHVSLLEAIQFQLGGRPSTGSILSSGSGSQDLVAGWLRADPWLPALGVALAPIALIVRRLRPVGVAVLILIAIAVRPGYLPQPYVIALLPFAALVIAGVLDSAARLAAARWPVAWSQPATAAVAVLLPLAIVAPTWRAAHGHAMHADQTSSSVAATQWISEHVDKRARLLVDDTFYVDLVRAGFKPRFGIVWFYKLDFTTNLDPSVARALPKGWRAFDYVVSSDVIRSALRRSPHSLRQVRLALLHSREVAHFGSGSARVEVRRITGQGTGSGFIQPHRSRKREESKAKHGKAEGKQRAARSDRKRGRSR
jgi:hypothetical protein